MAKLKSSKKVLIASLLVGVLVLGAVVSLILVLAAPQQNVKTNVKVSYVVDGVGASVSAKYHIVNPTSGVVANSVSLSSEEDKEELEFEVSDDESDPAKTLNPETTDPVQLTSTTSMIVYEYAFTNTTTAPFMVLLSGEPSDVENMDISYKSTGSKLTNFTGDFDDTTPKAQLVLNKDQTIYFYIGVRVSELNKGANYSGNIEWSITHVQDSALKTLTLNNGTAGTEELKYLPDVQLPHLSKVPSNGTKAFMGYKNAGGTLVYDENGNSLAVESVQTGVTYTAEWIEAYQISQTGELTGLTPEAQNMKTLNISESVTTMNAGVFNNTTTSATTINIPSSVTTIGESAFEGNTVVENINIAEAPATAAYADEKLTSIGAKAFKGCTNLKHLVLPSNVISVPNGILMGCKSLEKLECNTEVIGSADGEVGDFMISGLDQLYGGEFDWDNWETNGIRAAKSIKEVYFNGGTTIGCSALYNSSVKKVTMSDSVITISNEAFYRSSLEKIEIGNSVEVIGDCAIFGGFIKSLIIPDSVKKLGVIGGITDNLYIGSGVLEINKFYAASDFTDGVFPEVQGLNSLIVDEENQMYNSGNGSNCIIKTSNNELVLGCKSTIIPNNVKIIGDYSFANATISSINLPEELMAIGCCAFYDSSLQTIILPKTLKYISDRAFYSCSRLTEIIIPNEVTGIAHAAFESCDSLESVVIGTGITAIEMDTFRGCRALSMINIPENVKSIDSYAFYCCDNLTSVIINGVVDVSTSAFLYCEKLIYNEYDNALYLGNSENPHLLLMKAKSNDIRSIVINETTKAINQEAFDSCQKLNSIAIPGNVTSIGNSAFKYCRGLKTITISESVISIGYRAFSYCIGLTSVIIPNSVTTLEGYLFSGCSGLKTITIPESVTSIGDRVFEGCTSLEYNIYDNAKYLGNSENLYVALINASGTGITSCEINENTKVIAGGAFRNCTSLTSITIPESVMGIGEGAFSGCTKLSLINIENQLNWATYKIYSNTGMIMKYSISDLSNAETNANNLKNINSSSPTNSNWGYYILKRTDS